MPRPAPARLLTAVLLLTCTGCFSLTEPIMKTYDRLEQMELVGHEVCDDWPTHEAEHTCENCGASLIRGLAFPPTPGCGPAHTRWREPSGPLPYVHVRATLSGIGRIASGKPLRYPFKGLFGQLTLVVALVELPISLAVDTALLPYTLTHGLRWWSRPRDRGS